MHNGSPRERRKMKQRFFFFFLKKQGSKLPKVGDKTLIYTLKSSWVGKILWRRKWQLIPVFLPGKSHGRRRLVDSSPWGHTESDTTERLHFHFQKLNQLQVRIKSKKSTHRYIIIKTARHRES